jgi:hypothetical protein
LTDKGRLDKLSEQFYRLLTFYSTGNLGRKVEGTAYAFVVIAFLLLVYKGFEMIQRIDISIESMFFYTLWTVVTILLMLGCIVAIRIICNRLFR